MDSDIIQTSRSQPRHISRAHFGWRAGEFLGISAESLIDIAKRRPAPIARDGINVGVGGGGIRNLGDLGTEVMRMRADSVDAMVGFADHDREHLTLRPRQGRLGEHGGAIHFH